MPPSEHATASRDQTRRQVTAAVIAVVATALFLAPWWNRFLGITLDGYMPEYGHLIRQGEIPYRDFFLNLPPLQALYQALLESIAGRSMLAVRITGVVGRLAIAALLSLWLARRFRPSTAVLATLASVWISSGDDTEILDLYNHHALLAMIASGYLACLALDAGRWKNGAWLAAGAAAAIAFWTKQTIGLGASLAVPFVIALLFIRNPESRREYAGGLGRFALGWVVPGLLIGGWLASHHALEEFWRQTFVDAVGSKGTLWRILIRPWFDPFTMADFVRPATIGCFLGVMGLAFLRAPAALVESGTRFTRQARWWFVPAIGVLLIGWAVGVIDDIAHTSLRDTQRIGVFMGAYGILLPAAIIACTAFRRRLLPAERERLVLIVIAAASAVTLGFSFPSGEAIALPSLAVVIALLLDGQPRSRLGKSLRWFAITGGTVATVAAVSLRLVAPFGFNMWIERPVTQSTERSVQRELRGMRLSRRTRDCVDTMVSVIHAASNANEPVFTYPDLPLFLWLADRPPATFALLHWFDVTPDRIVTEDQARLLASPPPVIVRQSIPAKRMAIHEDYYRRGQRSALRELGVALQALLDEQYVLAASTPVPLGKQPPIEAWVRRDRAAERGIIGESADVPRARAP